jgi:hypothetical protein
VFASSDIDASHSQENNRRDIRLFRGRNLKRNRQPAKGEAKPVSHGRHASQCHICAHAEREQIEQDFVNWLSPLRIGEQYAVSADGIYRHARALDLMEKRRRNVRAALERIIEKAGEVDVNAAAVVSAVGTYARINNRGEFVERTETVNFERPLQADDRGRARCLRQERHAAGVV